MEQKQPILSIDNLKVSFPSGKEWVDVVDGVSFDMFESEILGIVGESGCGKSMTALSCMRLTPYPSRIQAERFCWNDKEILSLSDRQMRQIRGNEIGFVFQEPMSSLNPLFTIGFQIEEVLKTHTDFSRERVCRMVYETLEAVAFPYAKQAYSVYPHQLSGGMRQRAMIAMAIACNPKLVIADEPTTALDVTVQAQIMQLFIKLVRHQTSSLLLISHDLSLVLAVADRVVIMYAGEIVEIASAVDIKERPLHPYTNGLLHAIPGGISSDGKLYSIPGEVPDPKERPGGCRFFPRCTFAREECEKKQIMKTVNTHEVRCWRARKWENGLRKHGA